MRDRTVSVALDRRLNMAGVRIPARTMNRLRQTGIYARPSLSLEHQGVAKRYVVRGIESGGATEELGHYVTFTGENGEPLCSLQTIDSLRSNGAHAVIIAPVLVRVELFRFRRTCDLTISFHRPVVEQEGHRPKLHAEQIFSCAQGCLAARQGGADQGAGDDPVMPQFFTRSGEVLVVPATFRAAVIAVSAGASCIGCSHPHYSRGRPDSLRNGLATHEPEPR